MPECLARHPSSEPAGTSRFDDARWEVKPFPGMGEAPHACHLAKGRLPTGLRLCNRRRHSGRGEDLACRSRNRRPGRPARPIHSIPTGGCPRPCGVGPRVADPCRGARSLADLPGCRGRCGGSGPDPAVGIGTARPKAGTCRRCGLHHGPLPSLQWRQESLRCDAAVPRPGRRPTPHHDVAGWPPGRSWQCASRDRAWGSGDA